MIIEDEKSARERDAEIYAQVCSVKSFFDAYRTAEYDPRVRGLRKTMWRALDAANLSENDIDYISAAANSVPLQDKLETLAIKEVFNIYAKGIPISSIKSMIGESMSASGLLQVSASIGSINKGFIPPTINYEVLDPDCDLNYVANKSQKRDVCHVLINNFGPGGNNTSAVISKYE